MVELQIWLVTVCGFVSQLFYQTVMLGIVNIHSLITKLGTPVQLHINANI